MNAVWSLISTIFDGKLVSDTLSRIPTSVPGIVSITIEKRTI